MACVVINHELIEAPHLVFENWNASLQLSTRFNLSLLNRHVHDVPCFPASCFICLAAAVPFGLFKRSPDFNYLTAFACIIRSLLGYGPSLLLISLSLSCSTTLSTSPTSSPLSTPTCSTCSGTSIGSTRCPPPLSSETGTTLLDRSLT